MLSTSQSVKNDPRIKLVYPLISSSSITYQTIIWWSASAECRWEYIWVGCRKLFETMLCGVISCSSVVSSSAGRSEWSGTIWIKYLDYLNCISTLFRWNSQVAGWHGWHVWCPAGQHQLSTKHHHHQASWTTSTSMTLFTAQLQVHTWKEVSDSNRGTMPTKFFLTKMTRQRHVKQLY